MNNFSEREWKIIKAIGKKRMSLRQISKVVFTKEDDKPFDDTISIGNSVRRIIDKCKHYNLAWTLKKETVNGKVIVNKVKL
jgi:hypothetical protein